MIRGPTISPMGPRTGRCTVLVALALGFLSACGGTGSGSDLADVLEGRTFLTRTVTQDSLLRHLAEGSELRLSFDDGTLALNAGCNHLRGDYRLADGRLEVGPIGGTEMGCSQELMAQDQWLIRFFADPVEIALDEDVLALTSGTTVLTLRDRTTASPDVPLVGTSWTLTTLIDGDTARSVPHGLDAGLEIDREGRLHVDTGCNGGSGPVDVLPDPEGDPSRGTLAIGPVAVTRKGCAEEVMSVERAMLTVLDGEVGYAVEERSLTLSDGESGLGFTAGTVDR